MKLSITGAGLLAVVGLVRYAQDPRGTFALYAREVLAQMPI